MWSDCFQYPKNKYRIFKIKIIKFVMVEKLDRKYSQSSFRFAFNIYHNNWIFRFDKYKNIKIIFPFQFVQHVQLFSYIFRNMKQTVTWWLKNVQHKFCVHKTKMCLLLFMNIIRCKI